MEQRPSDSLDVYLARDYSLRVLGDPDGGYVIDFPDLPGCMTQVDELEDVSAAAVEIKRLWLQSALRQGLRIPEPTFEDDYSGKFNLRLPRSLHRRLAEAAERDGVSLNQYVVMLLSEGVGTAEVRRAVERLEDEQERLAAVLAGGADAVANDYAPVH